MNSVSNDILKYYLLPFLSVLSQVRLTGVNKRFNLLFRDGNTLLKLKNSYMNDNTQLIVPNRADRCMLKAIEYNCIEIVQLMITKKACKLNLGLAIAVVKKHMNIAQLLINMGANDFNFGLATAASYRSVFAVHYMLDRGVTDFTMALHQNTTVEIRKKILDAVKRFRPKTIKRV